MAEPQSLVRLDAYRKAPAPDVEFGPTWWDRHGSIPKADDAESVPTSREEGPDTVRLRQVKANGATLTAGEDVDLEAAVEEDKSSSAPAGFKEWSTAYVLRLALFDMLVGSMAVAIPSLNSNSLGYQERLIVTLSLLGAIVWPATIAGTRGYDRRRIGFGNDEVRSILRAAMGLVLVGAFWAGLFGAETFLKLAVVATPFAAVMSLGVRFLAHQQLHRRQRTGANVRRVVVVGGWAAAKHLRERLDAEPAAGMRIIGACIPNSDVSLAHDLDMPVLGNLDDVSYVVENFTCDAVAVTSDDATRHNYLRRLSWSLEGSGVEMLVDPGLVEVAGPRMHIRPLMGFPLLHVEEPHFTGWRRILKRAADLMLASIG